jgi:hypothetical protein
MARKRKLILESAPAPRRWPRYSKLMQSVRHALWMQPFEQELEAALQEQVDDETKDRLAESLKRHVDAGQAEYDAAKAAQP